METTGRPLEAHRLVPERKGCKLVVSNSISEVKFYFVPGQAGAGAHIG